MPNDSIGRETALMQNERLVQNERLASEIARLRRRAGGRSPQRDRAADGFSRSLRGLRGEDHASSQEVETGAAIALALYQLEPIDLSLGLAAAARVGQR